MNRLEQGDIAVLVVSFGTSYKEALKLSIDHVEGHIEGAVSKISQGNPIPVFRAFTSNRVIEKLRERDGFVVDRPKEAISALIAKGYKHIVVQPLHMIPGFEYDKLKRAVSIAAHNRQVHFHLGRPLLHDHSDYGVLIEAIKTHLPDEQVGQGILWMGHGTEHPANASYVLLERLWQSSRKDVHIANVDGYPELDVIVDEIASRYNKVHLQPLMLVAGDHALNDMAGDEDDSMKSVLEARGLGTTCHVKGLGEYPEIAEIFASRVVQILLGIGTAQ